MLDPGGMQVKTDKEGRFRAAGLVPGQEYALWEANRLRPAGSPGILGETGKNKDLDDVTIDAGNREAIPIRPSDSSPSPLGERGARQAASGVRNRLKNLVPSPSRAPLLAEDSSRLRTGQT